ncbi:MAG: hypothetical protein ACRDPQ_16125 [Nocardioidaceae bacterium]
MSVTTAPKRYRVVAQCVLVRTAAMAAAGIAGRTGMTIITAYKGALLPEDAPVEDVERLLARGMVEEATT